MLEAIDRILRYSTGLTIENLRSNEIIYYGLVKNIEIIGEAAYKLTESFRSQHQETAWRKIISMRHVLVHGYYQIKEHEVLYVIEDDLPTLRNQIAKYLSETDWEKWEKEATE